MLKYSDKLDDYVRRRIIPKVVLNSEYKIRGSFSRKYPYITDIDITNTVYDEINETNLLEHLRAHLRSVTSDPNLIFVYAKCGIDERFVLKDVSELQTINELTLLLEPRLQTEVQSLLSQHEANPEVALIMINHMLKPLSQIRWTEEEIMLGTQTLIGGIQVNLQDMIESRSIMMLKYYAKLRRAVIGVDVAVVYREQDMSEIFKRADFTHRVYDLITKQYYFLLFPIRWLLERDDQRDLIKFLEVELGPYKQLLVQTDDYHRIYVAGQMTDELAKQMVSNILTGLSKLKRFRTPTARQIISVMRDPGDRLAKWDILLQQLNSELSHEMSSLAQPMFSRYLQMIPQEEQKKFFLSNYIH